MYARGMTVREIQGHLRELYGVDVSPDLISTVTDAVLEEVAEWQNRPLDALYAIVFFDALRVKIRDEGTVRNKAIYVALGMRPDGTKEVLGLWIEQTEGAKFWLRVMNELKNRGIADILLAVVDGLKGFPEAINAVFPLTQVQTCIVASAFAIPWISPLMERRRKPIAAELKAIYRATPTPDVARRALEFDAGVWGRVYRQWRRSSRNWECASVLRLPVGCAASFRRERHGSSERRTGARRASEGHFPTMRLCIAVVLAPVRSRGNRHAIID